MDVRDDLSFSACLLVSVVTPFRISDTSNPIGRQVGLKKKTSLAISYFF